MVTGCLITSHQSQITSLENQAKAETDYLKREQLLTRLKELEAEPQEKNYLDQIQATQIQIKEITELDRMKRQEGHLVAAEKNRGRGVVEQDLRFTGFLTTLTIESAVDH